MLRTAAAFLLVALPSLATAQSLQTVAEKSDYKSTSRGADVVQFCEAIARRGPVARLDYFGTSHEGRKLPLLVISKDPVATPEDAKKSGKLVVLAFANIHAGEVDGKETLLAFARDLTDKKDHPLLKDLVILLVPNLNADGNEKIDPKNRPGDNGPPNGAGTRANAQGLDLNRDFVKLESPEIRALVKLIDVWNPAMVIDCHTTNGSKHRYTLTYDGPRYPATDTDAATWVRATLFPAVTKHVKDATGFDLAPYGNFNRDRTKWETYPATPRYSIQYFALCGRVGILSESYSYATFKDRIDGTKAFVTACFTVAAEKRQELVKLAQPIKSTRIALRTKTEMFPETTDILGFEEIEKDGKRVATDKPKTYPLHFVGRVTPTEFTEQPFSYLIPATETVVIETLQRHGIKVEELREDIDLDTESLLVSRVETQPSGSPNRRFVVEVGGEWKKTKRRVPAGTVVVKTGQSLGVLASYLLEPRSEDGFTTWAFFGDKLAAGADFTVQRLAKPYPMALGSVRALPETRRADQPVTEALLMGTGGTFTFGFAGTPLTTGAWVDAEHFLQVKEGKLLKVEARTGRAEPFADPALIKKSLAAIKDLDTKIVESTAKSTSFRTNPDRTAFLFDIGPDIGIVYFDGRPGARLTKSSGAKEHVSFAPNGKTVAFVRGNNLFVVDVEKPEEKQLTTDGGGDVFNAKGDWVYEEEIFNRDGKAYWWSPDGAQLAFLRFDDAPVRKFNLVDLQPVRGNLESYAYPKPGDPNPLVKIGIVSVSGGNPVFVDMGTYKPEDTVISRVGWVAESKTVFAFVQNRTQTWLDFVTWTAPDAKPKTLFRETTMAWVDDPGEPRFLPDGSFLFLSERTGWKHLYHYSAGGKLITPITKGDWEVRDVLRIDGKEKTVYFTAGLTSPTGTDFCRVQFGGDTELLSEKGRTHRVSLAPSGGLFVDRFGDAMTPTRSNVCEVGKGAVRKLDTNPVREREEFRFGKYERVKIELKDRFVLEGAITYPPNFDRTKKYPVWLFTYAGPHSPTLRDEWGGGRIMEQSLATSGVICFRVDPRSASGKGAQSAWTCYKQLGVQELKDLEEAVAWLAKNPYIDATRVGISGHSYGGFMAAFALTHSKTFSAGIASGPVTDWALYDTIYTERYMLTPKENPDGYAKSSCVAAAKELNGKLLIVHGMMDDNVHMQNSVQLADALQKTGKDFEMMLYPRARHGIGGGHYLKLQLDFIRRTMGANE
ncbi:peptidase s9 : Peptidase S9B dipeptidylpeptidase IV domain protein OS=Isosphaera pallida (strain ATCC 43644 / DSM 9630 / IS1B) GN=Isop_1654 PE=4 SV=1: Peptidase_M14: DPPIV_N: Peptidase_S9 [Gemmata massiliana]|uniref:Peptidase M14 domain-containing protein n=1 Tax=Gemmata massiliana TaxID=1210884 RepID=A0A6P2D0Y5_9BACT|nr:DPP IV N-terminal domain-containing protein [Gemmata massiliana]VTR93744.1 peptidase s9 : Peptidase S9B dipeptidylpeptidase IV domain protein OS=Isosphaera pallida (strain ATCC 43644 / DSM 9630 / IS1B) GN=Isop_1654 PE=4 SV=1: Peptidase_M14: DPPIV_N: Peptidase_S9 [Gemmata massiliana]